MKIQNCAYYLLLSLFLGCAALRNIEISEAVIKNDIQKLETILLEIKETSIDNNIETILYIESHLSDHYWKQGNYYASEGRLEEGINNYSKSLIYENSTRNKVGYTHLIKAKNDLDSLIHYFSSTDTINFRQRVKSIKSARFIYSPINKSNYIKSKLKSRIINKYIDLGVILEKKTKNDFEKYLQLSGFNADGDEHLKGKHKLFSEKYRKSIYNLDYYKNTNNRLYFLEFIDTRNKSSIQKHEWDEIINNLSIFYNNYFNPNFSKITDLYECYLINNIFENLFPINKPIEKYIENNTFIIKSKKQNNIVSKNIIEFLRNENIVDHSPLITPKKIIYVDVIMDTLWTEIDKESYKKEISSKYLFGTHVESNPKYTKNVDDVIYWEHEIARIRTANAACDNMPDETFLEILTKASCYTTIPVEKLNSARNILARTSTTIEVKDFESYTFSEIGHSIEGLLKLSINIEYSNISMKSVSINSHINIDSKSLIGVSINDNNNYKETLQLIPNDIILENVLIKNASKKVKNILNDISLLSTYISSELINKKHISNLIPSYKSNEFIELFSFTQLSVKTDPLKVLIQKKGNNFNSLKESVRFAKNASCQVISYNDNFSSSSGTGYFISNDGFLITNQHVINGKENIILLREIKNNIIIKNAYLLYSDKTKDIALLKTESPFEDSKYVSINNDIELEMGDEIIYVGYPDSPITSGSEPFTSRGIISQIVKRKYKTPTLILFDLTANPGSSGSAVLKEKTGELVGTLTWGFGRSITVNDIVDLIGGQTIRVKESQNVGTSVNVLIDFLIESGYYVEE
ncbi:MAG: trypsin-like peptidase domain-containing protein [Bacteroidetes bacterium]|nr:trypsin-like peptidase domain-containing protein [Bacteroidota bacterium]